MSTDTARENGWIEYSNRMYHEHGLLGADLNRETWDAAYSAGREQMKEEAARIAHEYWNMAHHDASHAIRSIDKKD